MPLHPEACPKCGKLTKNWFFAGNVTYIDCEHCGYYGTKTPYSIRM